MDYISIANCPGQFALFLIAFVRLHDPTTCFALDVATTDVLAVASFVDLFSPGYVATATAKVLAAFIAGTAAVALSAKEFFSPRNHG